MTTRRRERRSTRIPLPSCPGDKVHNRGRILRCERIMSLAHLDDDLDFAAKLLVSLFNLKRTVLEPWVEAAANVKKRHVGFGQGREIIERLGFGQGTVHARILSVDAGNLVRIFDGPG